MGIFFNVSRDIFSLEEVSGDLHDTSTSAKVKIVRLAANEDSSCLLDREGDTQLDCSQMVGF